MDQTMNSGVWVEFAFYWEMDGKNVPCFELQMPDWKYKSTVTAARLTDLGISIPSYPSFEEWTRMVDRVRAIDRAQGLAVA